MKIIKTKILAIILALGIVSCQTEKDEVIELPVDEVFSGQSALSTKIENITLSDGSFDNILDQSSCLSVVLPVTVVANDTTLVIEDESDFIVLEKIFDDNPSDDDHLVISFPITIIMADFTEVTVTSEDQFESLKEACSADDDDDIECIDFKFPITLSVFVEQKGTSEKITIHNDREFHDVIKDLENEDKIAFEFPITVILPDSTEVEINDNAELEDMVAQFENQCDEDDDNDFNDDDTDTTGLVSTIKSGEWVISYFFDDADETGDFAPFKFSFFEGDTAHAATETGIVKGSWRVSGDDGTLELDINFGLDAPLDELEDDWKVLEYSNDMIKLQNVSGGDGSIEFLTFSRSSNTGNVTLNNILLDNNWVITSLDDKGDDKTALFSGYNFDFSESDVVEATKTPAVVSGTWSILIDGAETKLILNFNGVIPFDELEEDWVVTSFSETSIQLTNISGGSGEQSVLTLGKM